MHTEDPRAALKRLCKEHGISLAGASSVLRRNSAYLHQYVTRGSPKKLEEEDRRTLAALFGVDEQLLGAPTRTRELADLVQVSRLDVRASAGPGAVVDDEAAVGRMGFDPSWLRRLTRARADELSIIRVSGDSMSPTLVDGDDVLVDRSEAGTRLRDGIYVLRRDDTLMVKRLAIAPTSATLTISSDNTAYPTWRDCPLDSVAVVGRAVWSGRRLG
jgi:phage repressor protein C with HTH and peptisase S24 domain